MGGHLNAVYMLRFDPRQFKLTSSPSFQDPYKGFGLPSVGRLTKYEEPLHIPGIRCDSGIREGSEISIYYDPLICKLVSHGKDRKEALDRISAALDHYVIRGVTHNIPLLRDIVEEDRFRRGDITTKYLTEVYPEGFQGATLSADEERAIIAVSGALNARKVARAQQYTNQSRQTSTAVDPYSKHYSFVVTLGEGDAKKKQAQVDAYFENGDPTKARITIDGKEITVNGKMNLSSSVLNLEVEGKPLITQIASKKAGTFTLIYKGSPFKLSIYPAIASEYVKHMKEKPKLDLSTFILSPMPGAIKYVKVQVGQMVSEGQELVVIEAMKMQNSLHAGKTGKVKAVNCKEGSTVDEGEVLVELE